MDLFLYRWHFAGALDIHNAQWQAMFGAAVSLRQRNDVYAFPESVHVCDWHSCTGDLVDSDGKMPHGRWKASGTPKLLFKVVCCLHVRPSRCTKIPGGTAGGRAKAPAEAGNASLTFFCFDLLEAITSGKNKALRWFFVPVVFFLYHLAA